MSLVAPYSFNNAKIQTVTIDGKVWTRAKEVVKDALEYQKKTAHVIRTHCSEENYAYKCQLTGVPATGTPRAKATTCVVFHSRTLR